MAATILEKVFVSAVYPQLRGTTDSELRTEALRRARRALAALSEAGYVVVPRASPPSPSQQGDPP